MEVFGQSFLDKGVKHAASVLWFARMAVAAVFLINVHCAVSFVLFPEQFTAAYELSGLAEGWQCGGWA